MLFWHVADPFNRANFRGASGNMFGGTKEVNVLALPNERASCGPQTFNLPRIRSATYEPPPRQGPVSGSVLPADAYGHLPAARQQPLIENLCQNIRAM
jgi:hypothetical protein